MSNSFCFVEAEFLGQHERLRHRDHRDAEDHVVADLRRLPVAGAARMHDGLAHHLQDRERALERGRAAADHEGERAGGGAADPARHRRVEHHQALLACAAAATTRALSTSMVDESISKVSAPAFSMIPPGPR